MNTHIYTIPMHTPNQTALHTYIVQRHTWVVRASLWLDTVLEDVKFSG